MTLRTIFIHKYKLIAKFNRIWILYSVRKSYLDFICALRLCYFISAMVRDVKFLNDIYSDK